MMFRFLSRRPTVEDAISYSLRDKADILKEVDRLERQIQELRAQINDIGGRVIPDYRPK